MLTNGPTGNVGTIYSYKKLKKNFSTGLQSFFRHSELNLENFRLGYPFLVKSKFEIQLLKQNYLL